MEKKKTCCFTGLRPQKLPFAENDAECVKLKNALYAKIRFLVEKRGVLHFISGMARGVDTFAAEAVLAVRDEFPSVELEAAVPCADQARLWKPADRERYLGIIGCCDVKTVLEERYTAGCMQRRNRYMVDNSDILIAVWDGSPGGTCSTVRYAEKRGKEILRIDL